MSKVYLSTESNHKTLIFNGPFVLLQRNLKTKINIREHSKSPKKLNTQEEFKICWLSVKLGVWFGDNSPHKHHRNEVADGMAWAPVLYNCKQPQNVWEEGPAWGAFCHLYFLWSSLCYICLQVLLGICQVSFSRFCYGIYKWKANNSGTKIEVWTSISQTWSPYECKWE